jgi:hypothetical protein
LKRVFHACPVRIADLCPPGQSGSDDVSLMIKGDLLSQFVPNSGRSDVTDQAISPLSTFHNWVIHRRLRRGSAQPASHDGLPSFDAPIPDQSPLRRSHIDQGIRKNPAVLADPLLVIQNGPE